MHGIKTRITTLIIAIVMACVPVAGICAPNESASVTIHDLSSDCYGLEVGQSGLVTFTASIDSNFLKDVALCDANGNEVAQLTHVGDNTYSASLYISSASKQTLTYTVKVGKQVSDEYGIRIYEPLTDADIARNDETWSVVKGLDKKLKAAGAPDEQILSAVMRYLETDSDVASVWLENKDTVNFETVSGIGCVYSASDKELSADACNDGCDGIDELLTDIENKQAAEANTKAANMPTNRNVGVYSPYYGADSNFTMGYITKAEQITRYTGGTISGYYGNGSHGYPKCDVASFKNFANYGVVMVDSHGEDYQGGGCICVYYYGSYSNTDVSQGHLVRGYHGDDYIGVRGTYMEKYCPTLPNSIVYFGICFGMAADHLWRPLTRHGAAVVCGYDSAVSFYFENQILSNFVIKLLKENDETGTLFTVEEAADYCIDRFGEEDPYSDYKASFVFKGNGNAILPAPPEPIPISSVVLTNPTVILAEGRRTNLALSILPIAANSYDVEWESVDESIASVSSSGRVKGESVGSTMIYCTVTDTAVEPEKVYSLFCTITVLDEADICIVSFYDMDKTLIEEQDVRRGSSAQPPAAPVHENAEFLRWDGNYESVTEDTAVYALYITLGDATVDGRVNTGDAVAVLRDVAGLAELTEQQKKWADITEDGNVNTGDAVAILRKASGLN